MKISEGTIGLIMGLSIIPGLSNWCRVHAAYAGSLGSGISRLPLSCPREQGRAKEFSEACTAGGACGAVLCSGGAHSQGGMSGEEHPHL